VKPLLPLLALAPLLFCAACEEKRATTDSYTGLRPAPTRVEPSRSELRRERKKDNPLDDVGEDLGDLFDGGDDDSKSKRDKRTGISIASPAGNNVSLPANFTGQTNFQDADGRKYRLRYERGTLVSIEPQDADGQKPPAETPAPREDAE
jgi:hypothetical protein